MVFLPSTENRLSALEREIRELKHLLTQIRHSKKDSRIDELAELVKKKGAIDAKELSKEWGISRVYARELINDVPNGKEFFRVEGRPGRPTKLLKATKKNRFARIADDIHKSMDEQGMDSIATKSIIGTYKLKDNTECKKVVHCLLGKGVYRLERPVSLKSHGIIDFSNDYVKLRRMQNE